MWCAYTTKSLSHSIGRRLLCCLGPSIDLLSWIPDAPGDTAATIQTECSLFDSMTAQDGTFGVEAELCGFE